MKSFTTQKQSRLGAIILGATVLSALAIRFYVSSEPVPAAHQPAPSTLPSPQSKVAESRVTFVPRMPSGKGVSVINRNGQYKTSHVLVAVPDQFHEIRYLPGSDPRAVKYLEETQASQKQTTFDNTPPSADLSSVAIGRDALSSQGKQIGVTIDKK
jgi:hypothetical protein